MKRLNKAIATVCTIGLCTSSASATIPQLIKYHFSEEKENVLEIRAEKMGAPLESKPNDVVLYMLTIPNYYNIVINKLNECINALNKMAENPDVSEPLRGILLYTINCIENYVRKINGDALGWMRLMAKARDSAKYVLLKNEFNRLFCDNLLDLSKLFKALNVCKDDSYAELKKKLTILKECRYCI